MWDGKKARLKAKEGAGCGCHDGAGSQVEWMPAQQWGGRNVEPFMGH